MRKLHFAILALLVSFNATAATNLNTAINKSLDREAAKNQNQSPTFVYGGKDISRSILAAAHESSLMKQQVLIG